MNIAEKNVLLKIANAFEHGMHNYRDLIRTFNDEYSLVAGKSLTNKIAKKAIMNYASDYVQVMFKNEMKADVNKLISVGKSKEEVCNELDITGDVFERFIDTRIAQSFAECTHIEDVIEFRDKTKVGDSVVVMKEYNDSFTNGHVDSLKRKTKQTVAAKYPFVCVTNDGRSYRWIDVYRTTVKGLTA